MPHAPIRFATCTALAALLTACASQPTLLASPCPPFPSPPPSLMQPPPTLYLIPLSLRPMPPDACAGLRADAAVTALMLLDLQSWVEQQSVASQ